MFGIISPSCVDQTIYYRIDRHVEWIRKMCDIHQRVEFPFRHNSARHVLIKRTLVNINHYHVLWKYKNDESNNHAHQNVHGTPVVLYSLLADTWVSNEIRFPESDGAV